MVVKKWLISKGYDPDVCWSSDAKSSQSSDIIMVTMIETPSARPPGPSWSISSYGYEPLLQSFTIIQWGTQEEENQGEPLPAAHGTAKHPPQFAAEHCWSAGKR